MRTIVGYPNIPSGYPAYVPGISFCWEGIHIHLACEKIQARDINKENQLRRTKKSESHVCKKIVLGLKQRLKKMFKLRFTETRKWFFLYTCKQTHRLRTVYRQRKWPLLAPGRKIMALVLLEKHGSIHEATRAIRSLLLWKCSGFVLHFHTRSAPTARFGLLYRNILFTLYIWFRKRIDRYQEKIYQWYV